MGGGLSDRFQSRTNMTWSTRFIIQNAFSEYFRDIISTVISSDMEEIFGQADALAFYTNFCTDAFLCSIKRWLLDKNCMPASEFVRLLKNCLIRTSGSILQKFSPESADSD